MPLNLFRRKAYVGVDLGADSIKLMQIEPSGDQWTITRASTVATPENAIKEGMVVDSEAVAKAVRQGMKEGRISATSAIIGVSGATVIVRSVRIPAMPEANLRKSIRFEAGRYVPSSIEDSFIEFEILGEAPENQMDVLIAAAPRELVKSRVRACIAAGLDVEVVDIEAFAQYRALVESNGSQELTDSTIALIDIGAKSTTVSVIDQGNFAMTRCIAHGGHTLTDALMNYFKLPEEEAEKGKTQLDLANLIEGDAGTENPPLRVVQPHVDDLVREIRRSLNYFESQQTEGGQATTVSKVVLSGGGASLQGLATYFENKLGLETRALGAYDNDRFNVPSQFAESHGYEMSVATGLAMRWAVEAA